MVVGQYCLICDKEMSLDKHGNWYCEEDTNYITIPLKKAEKGKLKLVINDDDCGRTFW